MKDPRDEWPAAHFAGGLSGWIVWARAREPLEPAFDLEWIVFLVHNIAIAGALALAYADEHDPKRLDAVMRWPVVTTPW